MDFNMVHLLKKLGNITGIILFSTIVLGFIVGIYFVGFAGLFHLLGAEYESIRALSLFVIVFFMIGFVIDLFVHPFSKIITEQFPNNYQSFFLRLAIGTSANWMILHALNAFMDTISITVVIEIIIAVFLFLAEEVFGDVSKKETS